MPTTADAIRLRSYWRKVPDRRLATYYRRATVGPPATYTSFQAYDLWHRGYANTPHTGNPGVYVLYVADLFLPKETNPTIATTAPPLPGDQVQDAPANVVPRTGRRWTVNTVEEAGAEGTWKLGCVRPAILNGLGIAVKVQRPAVSQTASGLRLSETWSDVSSQTGWVQQNATASGDVLGKRQIPHRLTVYLPTAIDPPEAQDTLYDVDNDIRYTILGFRPATDFVTFTEMDVERLF